MALQWVRIRNERYNKLGKEDKFNLMLIFIFELCSTFLAVACFMATASKANRGPFVQMEVQAFVFRSYNEFTLM